MSSNIDAIYRQFSFLEDYIERRIVERASVERVDADLALRTISVSQWWERGRLGSSPTPRRAVFEDILLLDDRGRLLGRVGQRKVRYPAKNFLWWERRPARSEWEVVSLRETVIEAADRRIEGHVRYVLVIAHAAHRAGPPHFIAFQ